MTLDLAGSVAPLAPLPDGAEVSLGYAPPVPRRYLMVYRAGDKVAWYDGLTHVTGANWRGYKTLLKQIDAPLARALASLPNLTSRDDELTDLLLSLGADLGTDTSALGNSNRPATHVLLCDLRERLIYLTPYTETEVFVRASALLPPPLRLVSSIDDKP